MFSYGVVSLLALATVSSAGPISPARRDSSLIPTPPQACLALFSTGFPGASSLNVTNPSSISNITNSAGTNTTTTCLVSPSALPSLMAGMNGTAFSNLTSAFNCTPPDTTSSLPPDTSTSTDSSAQPTDTSSSDPPASTSPPPASPSGDGSSGIFDPAAGQFSPDTSDPDGRRRKRSFLGSWTPTWLHRRTAPSELPAAGQQWTDLCLASGGDIFTGQPCSSVDGLKALASTGGVCDQQDTADNMIDFAKSPGVTNQADLIAVAIAFRQYPRNADDIGGGVVPSTPYCTKPPRHQELVGVVNAQLPGVNPGLFGGPNSPIVAFGADGTCPAGQTPDVSTCSCA